MEKFGDDGVDPVVPKMSLREPLPPAWFADQLYEREYEEEKERERQIVRVFLKVKAEMLEKEEEAKAEQAKAEQAKAELAKAKEVDSDHGDPSSDSSSDGKAKTPDKEG